VTAQDRKDRVPGPAEVWGLARAETRAALAGEKVNDQGGVAAVAPAVVVAKRGAAQEDVEQTGNTNSKAF
jgi:hypothetical protein